MLGLSHIRVSGVLLLFWLLFVCFSLAVQEDQKLNLGLILIQYFKFNRFWVFLLTREIATARLMYFLVFVCNNFRQALRPRGTGPCVE